MKNKLSRSFHPVCLNEILSALRFPATICLAMIALTSPTDAQEPTLKWYKGNTHAHSLWSDGNDFAEMIIDWYHRNDYQFAVLSDHNILAEGEKWMSIGAINRRQRDKSNPGAAIRKLEARFGFDWLEQRRNAKGEVEVRLKTLAEYRGQFEMPGKFLVVQAEEISATAMVQRLPVHINAVNLQKVIRPLNSGSNVTEVIRQNLRTVAKQEAETGQPILAHLNHPNYRWAVTARDLAEALEERFFEVYNGHPGINHLGDAKHPGDEAIWDRANQIRLAELKAPPLYGIATDDSHEYHGGKVSPGRGWVQVQAEKLDGGALVRAMRAGRFYASSGVELLKMEVSDDNMELRVKIHAEPGATYTTSWIGTRRADEAQVGEVFVTRTGTELTFRVPPDALYARAMIQSDQPHANPSYKAQRQQAWTQPIGWQRWVEVEEE